MAYVALLSKCEYSRAKKVKHRQILNFLQHYLKTCLSTSSPKQNCSFQKEYSLIGNYKEKKTIFEWKNISRIIKIKIKEELFNFKMHTQLGNTWIIVNYMDS